MKRTCFIATIGLLLWGQYAIGQQMKINQSQQIKDLMEEKKKKIWSAGKNLPNPDI